MPDDLYDLLGVAPNATTDEIRDRYRERRGELDAVGTEQSRADAAALNRAWNVLSDPYQRGRYDAQRESNGAEQVDADDVEIVDAPESGNGQAPRKRKLFEPADTKAKRPSPRERTPTITLPAGTTLAETRPRMVAMLIDLFVLFLIFFMVQLVVGPIEHHYALENYNAVTAANKAVTRADDGLSAADKAFNAVKKSGTPAQKQAAQQRVDAAKTTRTQAIDHADAAARKLAGYQYGALLAIFGLGLLYLVVPTAMTGQTLGKRAQHIRVVRVDGTPLGFGTAIKRFGLPVLAALLLYVLLRLGPVGALLIVIVLVGWTRNPNRQGMHDRFAKTIVVNTD